MVRSVRGRRRAMRGRNSRGISRNLSSAVRRVLAQPRENVRPRRFVRTRRGHGALNLNPMRNILLFAKKLKAGKPDTTSWWIEGLKSFGWLLMKLITVALTQESLDAHRELHSGPTGYSAGSSVVGCVQTVFLSVEDLLAQTQIATLYGRSNRVTIYYRQGRLLHMRMIITPTASLANRAGMVACAIVPLTLSENRDIIGGSGEVKTSYTFDEVTRLPSATVRSASETLSLVYSPSPGDYAHDWVGIGEELAGGHQLMGYACRLVFAYQDLTANTADVTADYSLTDGLFNLVLDGSCQVREISDQRVIPPKPYTGMDPNQVTVCEYGQKYEVPLSECYYHHGVLYHNRDTNTATNVVGSPSCSIPGMEVLEL